MPMKPDEMTTLIAIVDDPPGRRRALPVRHRGRLARRWATAVVAVGAVLALFVHLGTYAPWDDEAITALTARAVWHTGDTSARVDDHNLLAYRNGLLIRGFNDRFTPPLQFYLLAPVIGLLGDGNAAIRLPFALCGLATVALMLRWMWRALPTRPLLWWAAAFAVLTNYELFLFCRQCRYYGLAILLTTAVAYLYTFRTGTTRGLLGLGTALAGLLAAHYLNFAAVVACLTVDYAVWGRRRQPIAVPQWLAVIGPSLVVGAVVCPIWNPLAHQPIDGGSHGWAADHARLLWLNGRDAVASGFVCLPLVLAGPLLWAYRRPAPAAAAWLLRGPLAVVVFVVVTSLAAATPRSATTAEVRYLAPLLPVAIGVAVVAVWGTLALPWRWRTALLATSALTVMVGTRVGPFDPPITCDPVAFYVELARPQAEPYTPTIAWVRDHVPAGASVLVEPDWMAYPLMLRAPAPTYAWQLTDPVRPDLAGVAAVHVRGRVAPDYVVRFGPIANADTVAAALAATGAEYRLVATLPYHWQDMYRPECVWRTFRTVPPQDASDGIRIYHRAS